MQFKEGTHVFTSDGENAGSIDRVILDPQTQAVKGIVIRQGRFFTEDKVIPLSLIETADERRVTLRKAKHDIQKLARFEEKYYVPVNGGDSVEDHRTPLYDYPPVGEAWWGFGSYLEPVPLEVAPPYAPRIKFNIPEGTVAIREGARVIGTNGEHVGNVEDIFTDSQTDQVTHLVISHGLLFKQHKLIPTNWIKLESEDEVFLTVSGATIEHLPEYAPA